MSSVFDGEKSQQLKLNGMDLAAKSRDYQLALAKKIAIQIGKEKNYVTADDVGRVLLHEHGIETLGPAAGSLFRGKEWKWTGQWKQSVRISNHGRMIRVWEYKS